MTTLFKSSKPSTWDEEDEEIVVPVAAAASNVNNNSSSKSGNKAGGSTSGQDNTVTVSNILSASEFERQLKAARSASALETILNAFTLPVSELTREEANSLKSVLTAITRDEKSNITNKGVRRRMTRMAFAISNEEEKLAIKSVVKTPKPQQSAAGTISNRAAKKMQGLVGHIASPHATTSSALVGPPRRPAQECANDVSTITSADTLESVLQGITPETVESRNRGVLIDALKLLLENKEVTANAKARRRVSRLIQTFESAPCDEAQEAVSKVDLKSCAAAVEELNGASSADALETVLQGLAPESLETHNRGMLIDALNKLQDNKDLVSNAKMRRRLSRLVQTLESAATATPTATEPPHVERQAEQQLQPSKKARTSEPVCLTEIIHKIAASSTPEELDTNLTAIPWDSLSSFSASAQTNEITSLKELLTGTILSNEALVNNAKIRRRVKRTIEMIDSKDSADANDNADGAVGGEGGADNNDDSHAQKKRKLSVTATQPIKAGTQSKKPAGAAGDDNVEEEKHVPHVLFIGQLAFNTTASDIEKFLRENGAQHPFTVRMLTDAKTKE
jgi:CRISPR/Cas system-associated endoribonuclease Cas2